MNPSISILIVNYNTGSLLKRCLRSIFDTKDDLTVELFVADNNSTDESCTIVKRLFPEVALTEYSSNEGYTKAMNSLLSKARGTYCLLLHPDVELLPHTLKEFVNFFELHADAGILGANLYYPDGTINPCEVLWPGFKNDLLCFAVRLFKGIPVGNKLVGSHNPMEWSHKCTSLVPSVWNACMMVRREVFERIGYFDPQFFVWCADWDLCKRAKEDGWSIYYLHQANAVHHESHSFAKEKNLAREVLYKIDGWHSAPGQIQDRHVFLRKHSSRVSILGVKMIYLLENLLKFWSILISSFSPKVTLQETSFQARACLLTIEAILKY